MSSYLHSSFDLHKRDLQENSGTTAQVRPWETACAPNTKLIYRLKYLSIFDTETTEGENYQIAFPQVRSRLNSRGKIGLSQIN